VIKSEQINELATALVKAQIAISGVKKASKAFGYNYANLEAVIDAVKEPLNANGLSFVQLIGESSQANMVKVTTLLIHTSGQFIGSEGSTEIPEMKGCNLAQRAGAAQSYLKRYQLQALVGLPTEDNDASSEGFKKSTEVNVTVQGSPGTKTEVVVPPKKTVEQAKTEAVAKASSFNKKAAEKKVENTDGDLDL
jgi:cellobiose-specific phosphotransferase system component IIA